MRCLGIDFGDAKIGFAVGDDETGIAFARETIRPQSKEDLFLYIEHMIQDENIDAFIVGYPRSLSGEKSDQTKKVDVFINELKERFTLKVYEIDERLTSYEAQEAIKNGERGSEDSIAARIIVQNFLDKNINL